VHPVVVAHHRSRYLEKHIREGLKFSPIVGVLGQRQVGKTTLVEAIAGCNYLSLDDAAQLELAMNHPESFLSQLGHSTAPLITPLIAIDECQKAPPLFPALKLAVKANKRPGQFLLTGSVRFTSRKAIQESLTGRILNLEMLPFSVSEIMGETLNDLTQWAGKSLHQLDSLFERRHKIFTTAVTHKYLQCGGLPGICFLRKASHRNARFKAHVETLLQRDIRFVLETTLPYNNLLDLLVFLARQQGQPFSYTQASRTCRISQNTLRKVIQAYEALFLIRRVPPLGYRRADVFFLEDQGMATYLAGSNAGMDILRFLFSQLLSQSHYNSMNESRAGYFETKAGALVPLVFEIKEKFYGILPTRNETPERTVLGGAEAFLHEYKEGMIYIVSPSRRAKKITERIIQVPLLGAI
jgi:predicted AAA+ superfamily ATPase